MGDCKKKPEDCLKKSNILVYQQPAGQKQERKPSDCKGKVKIPICNPQPKHIKICTGKDLRKMCAPPVCPPCPPPSAHGGLLRILGFGLKSAIAAAVVYVTYDMGVWGSPDDTQQLYSNACTMIGKPLPKKNDKWDPPSCEAESDFFPHPPHNPYSYCGDSPIRTEDAYMKLKNLWNNGVTYVFQGLVNLPNMFTKTDPPPEIEDKKKPCVPYSELSDDEKAILSNNVYRQ